VGLSLEQWLKQVSQRSPYGGGSTAAAAAAMAAALLEKVAPAHTKQSAALLRRSCTPLIERDARCFARVMAQSRIKQPQAFKRALIAATDVQWQVLEHVRDLSGLAVRLFPEISRGYQPDLGCAQALLKAAQTSAKALIRANASWLNDKDFAQMVRKRLKGYSPLRSRPHGSAD
jgi:formiminotetrahydrofolate cyclodeaminase